MPANKVDKIAQILQLADASVPLTVKKRFRAQNACFPGRKLPLNLIRAMFDTWYVEGTQVAVQEGKSPNFSFPDLDWHLTRMNGNVKMAERPGELSGEGVLIFVIDDGVAHVEGCKRVRCVSLRDVSLRGGSLRDASLHGVSLCDAFLHCASLFHHHDLFCC